MGEPSIVERNARIIKWLIKCRNKPPVLAAPPVPIVSTAPTAATGTSEWRPKDVNVATFPTPTKEVVGGQRISIHSPSFYYGQSTRLWLSIIWVTNACIFGSVSLRSASIDSFIAPFSAPLLADSTRVTRKSKCFFRVCHWSGRCRWCMNWESMSNWSIVCMCAATVGSVHYPLIDGP